MKKTLLLCFAFVSFQAFSQVGSVIVTEFLPNPAAPVTDVGGEWIELYNTTSSPIDINGWTIKDTDTDHHIIVKAGGLVIQPGGFLLLGRNSDVSLNGGITLDYVYTNIDLANSPDEIILLDANLNPVDSVVYQSTSIGKSWSLDPADFNSVDNDNISNWCFSSSSFYSNNFGTPQSMNASCLSNVNLTTKKDEFVFYDCFSNSLRIQQHPDQKNWVLVNSIGKIVMTGNELAPELSLRSIPDGIYILSLTQDIQTSNFRFLKY